MLKIFKNPDEKIYNEVRKEVTENGNYCPCKIDKNPDTRCPCREFRECQEEGECCCGLYIKKEVPDA